MVGSTKDPEGNPLGEEVLGLREDIRRLSAKVDGLVPVAPAPAVNLEKLAPDVPVANLPGAVSATATSPTPVRIVKDDDDNGDDAGLSDAAKRQLRKAWDDGTISDEVMDELDPDGEVGNEEDEEGDYDD